MANDPKPNVVVTVGAVDGRADGPADGAADGPADGPADGLADGGPATDRSADGPATDRLADGPAPADGSTTEKFLRTNVSAWSQVPPFFMRVFESHKWTLRWWGRG
jgi:hypothetical protein